MSHKKVRLTLRSSLSIKLEMENQVSRIALWDIAFQTVSCCIMHILPNLVSTLCIEKTYVLCTVNILEI